MRLATPQELASKEVEHLVECNVQAHKHEYSRNVPCCGPVYSLACPQTPFVKRHFIHLAAKRLNRRSALCETTHDADAHSISVHGSRDLESVAKTDPRPRECLAYS